jgi:2-phospho-L-lactate guanylyltransferase
MRSVEAQIHSRRPIAHSAIGARFIAHARGVSTSLPHGWNHRRAYHADVSSEFETDLSRLHVVVPVRGSAVGKSRLGEALDPEERIALVVGLLVRTLDVLDAWTPSFRTHVVTPDVTMRTIVRRFAQRAAPVVEGGGAFGGLNDALLHAREAAMRAGATAIVFLPADLPLLSVEALDRLLEAADAALAAGSGKPVVVLAPADARIGTNALLLAPPDIIDPQFGEHSLEAHIRAAVAADASVQLVNDAALGFDLDMPTDLERLEVAELVELQRIGQDALDDISPASRAEVA